MALEVKLQAFEGPLDLLLHLIEKNKVDIYDIPIVEITDQYLETIRQMEEADMNVMSEFLVMAATLLDIKARMLLPREKDEEGEEVDPRSELVEKLLTLQEGDFSAKGTGLPQPENFSLTRQALEELLQEPPAFTLRDLAIGGKDLLALGYTPGPQLGKTLNALLEQVQQEQLPNDRQALLEAAAQSPPC